MLTICDLQYVETDWTFSGLVQFPKTLFLYNNNTNNIDNIFDNINDEQKI